MPLDSWHQAQEPPGVGFRIDCLAVVHCGSCGPGVGMLSVVMKRGCRVASSLRLSAEKPGTMQDLRVLWLSLAFRLVTCVHVPVTVHRSGQCRISYV